MLTANEKRDGKWYIGHYKIPNLVIDKDLPSCLGKPITVKAGIDRFYADPLVAKHNDLNYVFFEDFNYTKGTLSYYILDKDLNRTEPQPLDIDLKVHASFPFIFQDDGKYYMIPETCHLNSINLYENIEFPGKWRHKKVLIPNAHAGDTTVIKRDGIWWMFTYLLARGRYRFAIYYSTSILGNWLPHKLVNTEYEVANEHLSRGAGQPFEHNGKLYRPAQYSNGSINGEGVILYQVETITKDCYKEVPITIFSHKTMKHKFRCCHTVSLEDGLLSMDFRGPRDGDPEPIGLDLSKLDSISDQNYYVDHSELTKAFSLNTSGNGGSYYGANLGGKQYTGERDWDKRWDLLKNSINWRDKRVLDVGSNSGILLTYASKFRHIAHGTGVDEPEDMQVTSGKPGTIDAAKHLTRGLGVNNIYFVYLDLNNTNYEEILGYNYDIVCALSIVKWITDKERFIKYLSKFPVIIYEGHESDAIELERFAQYGYKGEILGKTQTGKSYREDDFRTLIHFHL